VGWNTWPRSGSAQSGISSDSNRRNSTLAVERIASTVQTKSAVSAARSFLRRYQRDPAAHSCLDHGDSLDLARRGA